MQKKVKKQNKNKCRKGKEDSAYLLNKIPHYRGKDCFPQLATRTLDIRQVMGLLVLHNNSYERD